jgi:hypothetical protein
MVFSMPNLATECGVCGAKAVIYICGYHTVGILLLQPRILTLAHFQQLHLVLDAFFIARANDIVSGYNSSKFHVVYPP